MPDQRTAMRRFHLLRRVDRSGVSGTGVVAEGVVFTRGWVGLTWLKDATSVAFYPSVAMVERVHGHGGDTEVVWLDEE